MSSEGTHPLSYAQQRLWFLDQLGIRGSVYQNSSSLIIEGPLNVQALQRGLDELERRHESLRTCFAQIDGEGLQVVGPPRGFLLLIEDLTGRPPDEQTQHVQRMHDEEVTTALDLHDGPLVRARLITLNEDRHVFHLTTHHIVMDGWSVKVFGRELTELYSAFSEDRPAELPALSMRYSDYSRWQRSPEYQERIQQQLSFWKEYLNSVPVLQMPARHARPAVPTLSAATHTLEIPEQVRTKLQQRARDAGATLFMILLTAYYIVLSRWSGQRDIVIGVPTAGRTRRETQPLIGFFVNSLPIRIECEEDLRFSELLTLVRQRSWRVYRNQDVPFERMVQELRPSGAPWQQPLFQAVFALHNFLREDFSLPGLTVTRLPEQRIAAQFDLSLQFEEGPGALRGHIEYSTELFDAEAIERFAGHLQRVLEQAAENPDVLISEIDLLDRAERETLLVRSNETHEDFPQRCVHELFSDQAARTPDAIALTYDSTQLTYSQLEERSNQLAHHLQSLGVGADTVVGLSVHRSPEMVIGMLGILKAGGAYLPLDPTYPAERLSFMLQDAGVKVLLTERELCAELSQPTSPPPRKAGPSNLAYVIYTSGSTGRPKGVMIEHRSLTNFVTTMTRQLEVDATDRFLALTTFSFDIAGLEIYLPLTCGARCVLAGAEIATDATALSKALEESAITIMQATPTAWRLLLEAQWEGRASLKALCGGEALPSELASRIRSRVAELWNLYGPTETTIWSSARRITAAHDDPTAIESIGSPIGNTQIYILDRSGQPAPLGVEGEIHIGGAGVARGYLRRPGLTAERFVADPFHEPGKRLYRTGDLGRWHTDGRIEYVGRVDDQVKIRGFRIEPAEIEAQLGAHPAIHACVVVARADSAGESQLVAYYTAKDLPSDDAGPTVEELREHLRHRVPEYMMPASFVRLSQWPLTPNGKLNRKALPAPGSDAYARAEYEAPRGEIEIALAEIWQQLLGVDRVGRGDSFFELGGHSLKALQLVARVKQVLGRDLPVRAVFTHDQLRPLAAELALSDRIHSQPIERADRTRPLRLSWAQERFWMVEHLDGGNAAYHLTGAVRLQGALDLHALRAALQAIVQRHEVLRTAFAQSGAEVIQHINPTGEFPLRELDLSDVAEVAATIDQEADEARRERFDLGTGPLIRGRLLKLRDDEHVLIITLHHIVSDAWSISVCIRELRTLYGAYRKGHPPLLGALPLQYADYAQWQRQSLQGQRLQQGLQYWTDHLKEAPAILELPTDRPRPTVQQYHGGTVEVRFDTSLSQAIRNLAQREGVTVFMTLYAGFVTLLSKLSGQQDLVVGTAVANRERSELEGLIGCFLNTLALRTQPRAQLSVRQLLAQVKDTTLSAYAHQDTPYAQVVQALQPRRDPSHNPVFQVMLTLNNAPQTELKLPGISLTPYALANRFTQFDLTLLLNEAGEEMAGVMEYASDLFDGETVARWVEYLRRIYWEMTRDASQPLAQISLLDAAERQQMLQGLSASDTRVPTGALIHELFEEQARRIPTTTAVMYETQSMTYADLNARANRIARYLKAQGVGPDQRVALFFERSTLILTALLGALKAGAAFLPLDPHQPTERLHYILKDAAPTFVLTQESLIDRLPVTAARVICLDSDWSQILRARGSSDDDLASLATGVTPSNLAYVIYTSGSTGRPKAVMVSHAAIRASTAARIEYYGPIERFLLVSPFVFDSSIAGIFGTLCAGSTLLIASTDLLQSPTALASYISEQKINSLLCVPSLYQVLLEILKSPLSLTRVVVAGEACPSALVANHFQIAPAAELFNEYGPTECAVWASVHRCGPGEPVNVPIGRPIADTQLYVLDDDLQPVPLGVTGELYIAGAGTARGYLNQPGLTAERFIANPHGEQGTRMYRTGDRVRYRRDGKLEYLGRLDDQIKLRGYRIELGEVEAALLSHPGVRQAAASVREDEPGQKQLVGYVVAADDLESAALRAWLGDKLPDHMIPTVVMKIRSLPLSTNGKLDRRALPAPDTSATRAPYEAPRTPMEKMLAKIWSEVLKVPEVGMRDSFFDLGGHSLAALRMTARIQEELKLPFAVALLFSRPTLGDTVATLERLSPAEHAGVEYEEWVL